MIYNDAYGEELARQHPALGAGILEVWNEDRGTLEPLVDRAYRREPTREEEMERFTERNGRREMTY